MSVITSLAFTVYSPGTAAQNIPGKNLPRGRVIHAEAIRITESEPSKNQGKEILECEGVGQFPVPFLVPAEAGGLLLYIRWHTIPCPTLKAKPHVTIRSSDSATVLRQLTVISTFYLTPILVLKVLGFPPS